MRPTESLSKILNIREKEKKDAQLEHHASMVYFEEIATQLYTLLNRKEDAEASYQVHIKKLTSIDKIIEQTTYIESLNQQITRLQKEVNEARFTMERKQLKLTDAHVEVKKFEKIIEFRKNELEMTILKSEQTMMDEISTQQYLSRKLGD